MQQTKDAGILIAALLGWCLHQVINVFFCEKNSLEKIIEDRC